VKLCEEAEGKKEWYKEGKNLLKEGGKLALIVSDGSKKERGKSQMPPVGKGLSQSKPGPKHKK